MLILLGILAGMGLPVQTSVNKRISTYYGSPFIGSFISFLIGTIVLALMILFIDNNFYFSKSLFNEPYWIWLGGIAGVIFVTANILIIQRLGSFQTIIFPILGQVIMGLIIDNYGFFESKISPISILKIIGGVLVFLGALMIAIAGAKQTQAIKIAKNIPYTKRNRNLFFQILSVAIGMISVMQASINGHLGLLVNSPFKSAFISFFIGTIFIFFMALAFKAKIVANEKRAQIKNSIINYTGGLYGAIFLAANVSLVPRYGTGFTVIILLLGTTFGGIIIDHFGLLGSDKRPITFQKIIGLILAFAGVAAIRLF